ncbi:MAG: hypothetical protein OXG98_00890 [Gemmatimonadetes bacterium]|nr:hypothetical protein [Gemmatimonadota bacterium]
MFADMRPDWLTLQRWAAIFAVVLFVVSATPHDHDGEECINGTCVPCHVQGLPIIDAIDRSGVLDIPDTPIHRISRANTLLHPRDAAIHGHDSRAPPA